MISDSDQCVLILIESWRVFRLWYLFYLLHRYVDAYIENQAVIVFNYAQIIEA